MTNIIITIALVLIFFGVLFLIIKSFFKNDPKYINEVKEIKEEIKQNNADSRIELLHIVNENNKSQQESYYLSQKSQLDLIKEIQNSQQKQFAENNASMNSQIQKMTEFQAAQSEKLMSFQQKQFAEIISNNNEQQRQSIEAIDNSLKRIQESNNEKISSMQKTVDAQLSAIKDIVGDKLDKTLNERLDSSFKQISDQLVELYRSLGELNKLSSGVSDLNKTLSNVKSRGVWGEIQLGNILEQTMVSSQYDTNVSTKKNSSDRVEFAIKIPAKDNESYIYLPIDSKMPADIYNRIIEASQSLDQEALKLAIKELEQRIKTEARTIRDKYIDPPNTTDFAVMFLPTEGLYSEVLRIDGLAEWCQTNCKIIISGPTTITALLNSLRVGFSNLALTKKSQEVLKLLQAIKTQYSTFNELIEKTQKKLHEAITHTDNLKSRTDIIQRKMSKVEELETIESEKILGLQETT